MLEATQGKQQKLIEKVIDYVVNRQNKDGGYTFCQGAESNGQDTYYGLSILNLLKTSFPNSKKTLEFVNEIPLNNIYAIYYVTKTLLLLGKGINSKVKDLLRSALISRDCISSVSFFSEVSSEFTTAYLTTELADLLKIKVSNNGIGDWLLRFKNDDGGFGIEKRSNINSTYYAIAAVEKLQESLKEPSETVAFLRKCEKSYGGFTVTPINVTPYMEHTYYGVTALKIFDEKIRYPSQTADFVLKCQNKNGGFARSDLGISTFENTFQAVSILQNFATI